ncbi:MAG TPA: CvpA family protein [Kiloniellales bacterium]
MDSFPVNSVDLIVLAVVLISGLFAFVRGLVHELLALGAWIGAGIATYYGIDHAIPLARRLTEVQPIADVGAGAALFLVVLIVLSVATRILVKQIRKSSLGALDRSLGLLFGLARGALIVAVAWLAAAWAYQEEPFPGWIAEARSLPLGQAGARALYDALPQGFRPEVMPPALESAEGRNDITFEDLDAPAPKAAVQGGQSGYNSDTRKGMDNLFQQNQ